METLDRDVRGHILRLVAKAGGVGKLATEKGLVRATIWNVLNGQWPTKRVADALGLELGAPPQG